MILVRNIKEYNDNFFSLKTRLSIDDFQFKIIYNSTTICLKRLRDRPMIDRMVPKFMFIDIQKIYLENIGET